MAEASTLIAIIAIILLAGNIMRNLYSSKKTTPHHSKSKQKKFQTQRLESDEFDVRAYLEERKERKKIIERERKVQKKFKPVDYSNILRKLPKEDFVSFIVKTKEELEEEKKKNRQIYPKESPKKQQKKQPNFNFNLNQKIQENPKPSQQESSQPSISLKNLFDKPEQQKKPSEGHSLFENKQQQKPQPKFNPSEKQKIGQFFQNINLNPIQNKPTQDKKFNPFERQSPSKQEKSKQIIFPWKQEPNKQEKKESLFPQKDENKEKEPSFFPSRDENKQKGPNLFPPKDENKQKGPNLFPPNDENKQKAPSLFPPKDENKQKTPSLFPQKQTKPSQKVQKQKMPLKLTSHEFLEKIITYSTTFKEKTNIDTKINNLNGAMSDINDLFIFSKSFLSTIDKTNDEQLTTFGFKIWDAIVNNFIKKTNVKDGFQRIPPKQKKAQVQKNSINRYILVVNIFRYLGGEKVWNCVFGRTLKMLSFLYKSKQAPKDYKDLQLFKNQYIPLDKDVSIKYLTRLDSLTYFLFGLTCLDPMQVIEDIGSRTGDYPPFVEELKKSKYQWSYKQFWNLFSVIKQNEYDAYHRPIVYMNMISITYPQILKNKKSGHFQQFVALQSWLIDNGNKLLKRLNQTEDFKLLRDQEVDNGVFEFDGEQLCNAIKTVCNRFAQKQKQLKIGSWKQYQEKCSIFYYFWKQN